MQTADKCNGSTPANWVSGNPIIQNSPQTFQELMERVQEIETDRNGMSWYLSFKESCMPSEESRKEETEEKK